MHQDQSLAEAQLELLQRNERLKVQTEKPKSSFPWFIVIVSIVEVCVFIAELIVTGVMTGRLRFTPTAHVLIKMGAAFTPCLHKIKGINSNTEFNFLCPATRMANSSNCTLADLCHLGDSSYVPKQWYRMAAPIFLHAHFLHILINVGVQLLIGYNLERQIGTLRFAIIYLSSGIFGFVLGNNFTVLGLPRVGCSGSMFGVIGTLYLLFFYQWNNLSRPITRLIILIVALIIDFTFGLLPAVDNFSHIGGFFMGMLVSFALLNPPIQSRSWIWLSMRIIIFAVATIIFVLFTVNIYTRTVKCSWCKYLSCLPIRGGCDFGRLGNITI